MKRVTGGSEPEVEARLQAERDRNRRRDLIADAMRQGDLARAQQLLDEHTATIPVDPRPEPPAAPAPAPAPAPAVAKPKGKARKAKPARSPEDLAAADRSRATLALVFSTLKQTRAERPDIVLPSAPFQPLTRAMAAHVAIGAAGKLLTAQFRGDPDLTAGVAAAAIWGEVLRTHRPVRLTLANFTEWTRRALASNYRQVELYDADEGRWLLIGVGLTRYRDSTPAAQDDGTDQRAAPDEDENPWLILCEDEAEPEPWLLTDEPDTDDDDEDDAL